jgi:hypothetical protein
MMAARKQLKGAPMDWADEEKRQEHEEVMRLTAEDMDRLRASYRSMGNEALATALRRHLGDADVNPLHEWLAILEAADRLER